LLFFVFQALKQWYTSRSVNLKHLLLLHVLLDIRGLRS
jgi:hypothetical protein